MDNENSEYKGVLIFEYLQEKLVENNIKVEGISALKKELFKFIETEQTDKKIGDFLINREILLSILDSIKEGVEIADSQGIIKYVNPSLLKMLNIEEDDRLNKSVFDVSADGSLAYVLENQESIRNLVNFPKGTSAKLVSNASPLYICGEMVGAISTMRDQKEIFQLTKKLNKSKNEVRNLSEKIHNMSKANYYLKDFVGETPSAKRIKQLARKASNNNTVVLLEGETGTGKEILAQAIHNEGPRSNQPFITVNCAAIQDNLLESEFFGHEKGAFTGAQKRKLGKFELADKGTIFLDEISEMSVKLQAKLLRVIQEREFERVGGENKITVDVRVITATNRKLSEFVKKGKFRKDLYYRLNVWNIEIPPLRERKEDLEILVEHILHKKFNKMGKRYCPVSEKTFELLYNYNWPGNVRELENVLERAVINCNNFQITPSDLELALQNEKKEDEIKGVMSLDKAEKIIIKNALDKYGNSYESKLKIADKIGISVATLYNKIKKYNITS